MGNRMLKKNCSRNEVQSVIDAFNIAEEAISHSIALSQLLLDGNIKSADLQRVNLPFFIKKIDWAENAEQFRELAESLPLAVFSLWVIICSQAYFDLFDGRVVDKK